jgi:hypothetical protein
MEEAEQMLHFYLSGESIFLGCLAKQAADVRE